MAELGSPPSCSTPGRALLALSPGGEGATPSAAAPRASPWCSDPGVTVLRGRGPLEGDGQQVLVCWKSRGKWCEQRTAAAGGRGVRQAVAAWMRTNRCSATAQSRFLPTFHHSTGPLLIGSAAWGLPARGKRQVHPAALPSPMQSDFGGHDISHGRKICIFPARVCLIFMVVLVDKPAGTSAPSLLLPAPNALPPKRAYVLHSCSTHLYWTSHCPMDALMLS